MTSKLKLVALAVALTAPLQSAFALCAPVLGFGTLAAATFGGSGIPNTQVKYGSFNCTLDVTLGLTATQRYSDPALTNDGIGTFYAVPGNSTTAPSTYAKWNFDFYIGGAGASNYYYSLFMDKDVTAGTNFLRLDLAQAYENSWNIGMGFYGGNPNATGDYTYTLAMYLDADRTQQRGEVSIDVLVGSDDEPTSTPEPASLVLVATGLIGVAGAARRRRSA